ncbi:MAG: hypothetical protein K0R48_882 [Gammaproteobacteria bacterium]|jgi:hypothetical protein|nr:hypothetical protein [Gammaproteobacteria bacterium]
MLGALYLDVKEKQAKLGFGWAYGLKSKVPNNYSFAYGGAMILYTIPGCNGTNTTAPKL